jgi:serine protease Do
MRFPRQSFGDQFSPEHQMPREEREHSLGSVVIVSADGYVSTNDHVVDGASEIKVTIGDKHESKARVIGDSSKVRVGEFALALGNPFGLNQTVYCFLIGGFS